MNIIDNNRLIQRQIVSKSIQFNVLKHDFLNRSLLCSSTSHPIRYNDNESLLYLNNEMLSVCGALVVDFARPLFRVRLFSYHKILVMKRTVFTSSLVEHDLERLKLTYMKLCLKGILVH